MTAPQAAAQPKKNIFRRLWKKATARYRMTSAARRARAFLVSYPKSGRTWLRFILSNYFAEMLGETEPTSLVNMFRILPNFDLDDVRGLPAFQYRDDPAVPLIPVTHRPYNRSLFLGRPVIFLVRDPRDVTVSSYFHATRHKHRFNGDIAAFMKDEEQGLPDLLRYLDGWAGALNEGRDLVVSYEELSAEPADVTRRILEFLKVPIDRVKVEKAVHASRFEAMRELEVKEGIPAHDYDRSDAESMRMRKGKAGGFTEYLDAGGVAALQKAIAERLSPAGKALLLRTGYKEV